MSKSIVKSYEAYPLNKYNCLSHEYNAKRVGFQLGYEQGIKEASEWIEKNAANYMERQKTIFGTIKVFNTDKMIKDLKKIMID